MSMNRHEPFEELISASLHGDLTADERTRLDAHLDGCEQCRSTLASFSDQRESGPAEYRDDLSQPAGIGAMDFLEPRMIGVVEMAGGS